MHNWGVALKWGDTFFEKLKICRDVSTIPLKIKEC